MPMEAFVAGTLTDGNFLELHMYILIHLWGPFLFAHMQEDCPNFDTNNLFIFIILDEYYGTSLSELCR